VVDRRRAASAVAFAVLVGLLAAATTPVEQTEAAWTDREIATASLSTKSLPAVPNFACPADGASFTWSTPPVPYTGAVLSGYEFSYVQLLTANAPTVVALPATATSTTIPSSSLVLLTSYRVSITAKYSNWVTPPATRTLDVLLGLGGLKLFGCGA